MLESCFPKRCIVVLNEEKKTAAVNVVSIINLSCYLNVLNQNCYNKIAARLSFQILIHLRLEMCIVNFNDTIILIFVFYMFSYNKNTDDSIY